jgi:hypothetical protein
MVLWNKSEDTIGLGLVKRERAQRRLSPAVRVRAENFTQESNFEPLFTAGSCQLMFENACSSSQARYLNFLLKSVDLC